MRKRSGLETTMFAMQTLFNTLMALPRGSLLGGDVAQLVEHRTENP